MEVATGLKVNWSKSTISPVGYVPEVEEMVSVIGCDVLPLPIEYLRFPLGAKSSSKSIWNLVLEKMGSRLAQWKTIFHLVVSLYY